tara:strand:+ start:6781 stop:8919 length:2139 start_codon:yes stop_codon:yes gene_type:complete
MKSVFLFAILACLVTAAQAEVRTWTDSKDRKVEAELVGIESSGSGPIVQLRGKNGKVIQFPFRLLSREDQSYVKKNLPYDPRRAAEQIDALVWEKLRQANGDLKLQLSRVMQDSSLSRSDRLQKKEEIEFEISLTHPTNELSDEQFVRRVYLDIAGRIPTYQETTEFLDQNGKDKRAELIDDLLVSDGFTSHFFNYLSDLLRIRSKLSMNGGQGLHSGAYHDWVKDQIRSNRGWDEIVKSLVTAEGTLWENPAVGYALTDLGMPLCNLSNTFTVFLGTEITCAQCHDHPFEEVYQMDFYRMAAFFGKVETGQLDDQKSKFLAKQAARLQNEIAKLDAGSKMGSGNSMGEIMGSLRYSVRDGETNRTKLPHDYKYDDGEPLQFVEPATYFGEIVELENYPNPRMAFGDWLTSKENPRFTINLVNRLWKFVFGLGQIEPVYNIPGHLDGQAQNYKLLTYLESLMKDLDYDVKDFLRVLYNTETYQREACSESPTMAMIDKGRYHFPAPILRRMSSEQMWDSLVALTTENPESYQARVLEDYRQLMSVDFTKMSGKEALKFRDEFKKLNQNGLGMDSQPSRVGGEVMVRASEMSLPANDRHFLNMFGQSDKLLTDNGNQLGSIPQVLMMMNGKLTNETLSDAKSQIMKNAGSIRGKGDTVEAIFLSILSRYPTPEERSIAQRSLKRDRNDDSVEQAGYANLIWALLNTREFMFIQ